MIIPVPTIFSGHQASIISNTCRMSGYRAIGKREFAKVLVAKGDCEEGNSFCKQELGASKTGLT